jgi:hypothetical protein
MTLYLHQYANAFSRSWYDRRMEIFFKGWYAFVLVKLVLLGSLSNDLMEFQQVVGGISFSWQFAKVTRILIKAVLLACIILRRSYLLSIIAFAVTLWAHRVIHPIVNGGDLVILFFMFLGIFCNTRPGFPAGTSLRLFQTALTNFAILMGKIQVALIYLVSGWDKLSSQSWRDGSSLFNLLHVDFYPTNWVRHLTDGPSLDVLKILSWLVILFELLFPFVVWLPKWRSRVLTAGVVFHLVIGFGLSLPDFALVMIWCYLLLLKNQDMRFISKKFSEGT